MNEAPYSTNFVLHNRDGLRCQHTVRSASSIQEHVSLVDAALAAFKAAGHTITEAGLEVGEESELADGYVIGKGSNGLVLWWYKDRLKFPLRGGTVYHDHWQDLFFVPKTDKIWPSASKPTPAEAVESGFRVPLAAKVIIKQTEKVHEGTGKPVWKFVRCEPVGTTPVNGAPQTTAEPPADADALCNKIIAYLTNKVETPQNLVDASLRAFAQKKNLGEECWELVQKNVRARLVLFVNEASSDTEREELEAAVRAIGKVLPDGIADRYLTELAAAKSSNVPF